jgi:hypothetical protein
MEQYLKKLDRLKAGERQPSVVKSRSNSVEPVARSVDPVSEERNSIVSSSSGSLSRKVAYQKDIVDLNGCIDKLAGVVCQVKEAMEGVSQDLKSKLDDLSKQVENVKLDTEQTKSERIKQKLDSFINNYNQNETAHSDVLKSLEMEIKELSKRLNEVENVL